MLFNFLTGDGGLMQVAIGVMILIMTTLAVTGLVAGVAALLG